ncbi:monoamine oxidase [Mumia flava]|uniref:Monoamine oxidase n=1 Tax=Mumia flava TaxID=1348852 RepID=A0A0B2BEL8_9ACTN|nr:FAD-dependent oxidoreductase [Mumia flava]PJJ57354.1 monoamine oxidase [Mumia flava]
MANVDVIVVGAGVSGLVAADRVRAAGRSVVVLEARDRVGGRTWTETVDGVDDVRVDSGGAWVAPDQRLVAAELQRFGLTTTAQAGVGDALMRLHGRTRRYRGAAATLDAVATADVAQAMLRFTAAASKVSLEEPWHGDAARRYDAMTFETWIRRTCLTSKGRDFFRGACGAVLATSPSNVSLLHVLFGARSAGGLEHMLTTEGGAQDARVVGGMQQLAQRLAEPMGRWVRLEEPVSAILSDDDHVTVDSDSGATTAHRVIVTVPPALAASIDYRPGLPAGRTMLTQRMPHGSVIKIHAVYRRPFWREQGLSGEAMTDRGPVSVTFDTSEPVGDGYGVLTAFAEADDAIALAALSPQRQRAEVLDALADLFGQPAYDVVALQLRNWTDEEWTRGCYAAHLPPGAWTQVGTALRAPVGRIHWAGTETARRWCGYVDGAIESGERAAAEVLAALP